MHYLLLPVAFLFASLPSVTAHFSLTSPKPLGVNSATENIAPCGGFDPASYSDAPTSWPTGGYPLAIVTTHNSVTWRFRAALKDHMSAFMDLQPPVAQTGVGHVCFVVPGMKDMEGKEGFVQLIQNGPDGILYQCVAVNFVAGSTVTPPSECTNSSGVHATFQDQASNSTGGMHKPMSAVGSLVPLQLAGGVLLGAAVSIAGLALV